MPAHVRRRLRQLGWVAVLGAVAVGGVSCGAAGNEGPLRVLFTGRLLAAYTGDRVTDTVVLLSPDRIDGSVEEAYAALLADPPEPPPFDVTDAEGEYSCYVPVVDADGSEDPSIWLPVQSVWMYMRKDDGTWLEYEVGIALGDQRRELDGTRYIRVPDIYVSENSLSIDAPI